MGWPGSCFVTSKVIPLLEYSKIGCVFKLYKTYSRYQCICFCIDELNYNSGYSNRPRFTDYTHLTTGSSIESDIGYSYGTVNAWTDDILLYTYSDWRWPNNSILGVNMWGGDSGSGYIQIKQLWLEK